MAWARVATTALDEAGQNAAFRSATDNEPRAERRWHMTVLIPTPLHSYTGRKLVEAEGATLAAVLADLDRQFPGIRFRMVDEQDRVRRHVRFFVNGEQVFDLSRPLGASDDLRILQALSGG